MSDKIAELNQKIKELQQEVELEKRAQKKEAVRKAKAIIAEFDLKEADLFRKTSD